MAQRLRVAPDCEIPLSEIEWSFAASGGPGGQHANKTATRAEARLDLAGSPSLTDAQRSRLVARLGPVVQVSADDTRSQHRNRSIATDRLRDLLADALRPDVKRVKTRPTLASKKRRLDSKRRRADLKQSRKPPSAD